MKKWHLLFFLFVCNFIWGQQDSIYTLPEIELHISTPKKDSVTLQEGHSLSVEEDNLLHSDVSGYITQLPSVTIKDYGNEGSLKTVQIRGINAGLSTILLDGVKIPNSNTGQVDLSKVPYRGVTAIEQNNYLPTSIELPASSYNGNGFISLQTNKKSDSLISGIRVGSFGLYNPFLHVAKNKKHNLSLSVDHLQSEGNFPFTDINNEKRNRDNNKLTNTSFLGSYTFNISNKTYVKLQQSINTSEHQLPNAVILNSNQLSKQHLSNHHFNTLLQFHHHFNKWKLNTYITNNVQKTHYKDPLFLNSSGGISNTFNERNNLFAFNLSRKWKKVNAYFSSDLERNALESNTDISVNRYISNTIIGTTYKGKKVNISGTALVLNSNTKTNQNIYPSVSIAYQPIKKLPIKLRGFYKSYYRLPSFSELYYQQVGNRDLKTEEAQQVNLGIFSNLKSKGKKTELALSADVYTINHINKIIAIPTQNLFVWSYLNIGKVSSRGLELYTSIKTTLSNNSLLDFNISYTKQFTEDRSNHISANTNNQLPYIPFDVVKSALIFSIHKVKLHYNYQHNGFRFFHFENTFTNVLPAFNIHSFALSYPLKIQKNALLTAIGIKNLTNTNYTIVRSFPMPPRQFYFQLSYHI